MKNLNESLKIERELQKDGIAPKGTLHLHNVRARYTLEQDLETDSGYTYDLNSDVRDRLLVHARQDASLSVYAAHASEKLGISNRRLLLLIILLQCLLIWRVW